MADNLALLLGDQFDHRVAFGDQRIDQPGLGLLAECMFLDEPDRLAIPGRRGPY